MNNSVLSEPIQIKCSIQNYAWGKVGSNSAVYQLLDPETIRDEDKQKPFAELWMGTHPSAPSTLMEKNNLTGQTLKDFILSDPTRYLSKKVQEKYGQDLPFLLKVLSVSKALSIQAHPDKKLASYLHKSFPDIYKDDNHKPEMAIALTPFEALCGFRPLSEIDSFLKAIPELSKLLGKNACDTFINRTLEHKNAIKTLFALLMNSSTEKISQSLEELKNRLFTSTELLSDDLKNLFQRLYDQYPGDVGVFCIFFLNHFTLEPGQAIFLEANEPHAYIYGECMATSDNVVRAGLTPKFKDVDILVDMMTYESKTISDQKMFGSPVSGRQFTLLYDPPIPEFAVMSITINKSDSHEFGGGVEGPGILLITNAPENCKLNFGAESINLRKGETFFVPPTVSFTLQTSTIPSGFLQAFFAYCEA